MIKLTSIYKTDGRGWDSRDELDFLRDTIKGQHVICGRITFDLSWRGLMDALSITVLSKQYGYRWGVLNTHFDGIIAAMDNTPGLRPNIWASEDALHAIVKAQEQAASPMNYHPKPQEAFCVGGIRTLRAMVPFVSDVMNLESNEVIVC